MQGLIYSSMYPFNSQSHKMLKHSQTLATSDELFELFDRFLGLALNGILGEVLIDESSPAILD